MVEVKKGDLVLLEYTGRVASTGQVFETTDEALAKKEGIYNTSDRYGPKLVVFGADSLIAGLEEAIPSCEIGKAATFTFGHQKAFGEKNPKLLRMLPQKEFMRQNIRPVPGLMVALDGAIARVKSVTSGRVMVDFNHPLAGETVTYQIKVLDVIKEDRKKAEAILSYIGVSGEVSSDGGALTVTLSRQNNPEKLSLARQNLSALIPGIKLSEP